jgi:hypothetical protein
VEVQNEDRALFDAQAPEATLDLVAVSEARNGIVDRSGSPFHRVIDPEAPATPVSLPVAAADDEAMEPRIPGLRITEGTHVSPGRDERVLDCVLGAVRIAEDERRDGVETIGRRFSQFGECGVIALLSPFDERSIHARFHAALAFVATLCTLGHARARAVANKSGTTEEPALGGPALAVEGRLRAGLG